MGFPQRRSQVELSCTLWAVLIRARAIVYIERSLQCGFVARVDVNGDAVFSRGQPRCVQSAITVYGL